MNIAEEQKKLVDQMKENDSKIAVLKGEVSVLQDRLLKQIRTLRAKADLFDELVKALTTEYVPDTPLFEYPPTTYEKSYGGGDCSVHGRWYGICHCCRNASKKTSNRREQEVKWKKDAAVNDILERCKEVK